MCFGSSPCKKKKLKTSLQIFCFKKVPDPTIQLSWHGFGTWQLLTVQLLQRGADVACHIILNLKI